MNINKFKANRINTSEWYKHTCNWNKGDYFDASAIINPSIASSGTANPWEITVKLGETALEAGDHIAIEVNVSWTMDRGRPFVYGRQLFQEEWNPGYGATPKIELPADIEYEIAISENVRMNRYFIIDIAIKSGRIVEKTELKISLADPEGSLIRCPWYAQYVPVPIAVKKSNDTYYKRIKVIPVVHVIASKPRLWKVNAVVKPNHSEVELKMIAADIENLNPACGTPRPFILDCEGWIINEITKHIGYNGADLWKGKATRCVNASKHIEVLNREEGLYGKSNPIEPSMYDNMQVYFGDLHGQSDQSIGFGTEREYFSWARDAELLDFVAPANHYGGREDVTNEIWQHTLNLCDEFNKPGEFVTLYSYEWGGAAGYAHRNVYYEEKPGRLFDAHKEDSDSIYKLWDNLENQGLKAITVPHHTKFIGRINWNEHHSEYQCLVEVCSNWGNSEMYGPHSVQAALEMGHRLGIVGGTDTHFSQPGRSSFGTFEKSGLTGIICKYLDRKSVWKALFERRCYATTGERILLNFKIDNQYMGSILKYEGVRRMTGKVIGTSKLVSVEIVRNNKIWKSFNVKGTDTLEFEVQDNQDFNKIYIQPLIPDVNDFVFYYLRVVQEDGHWAMSSPIWIEI